MHVNIGTEENILSDSVWRPGLSTAMQLIVSVSPRFIHHHGGYHDLFVCP